ncbi:hypothetical protein KVR01_007069 [Diaporthe batatas]|uniref:uncharacterized protein n=1 Tax=Diaporthe batatas TaxID=748121 RepID=UPI001D052631|nr:uncharacterized protein KVR01_007069 [Diaporthe batatas]KAG8163772.1 hypothetical protein KVR01_007069 [Diaporthe batatas]
MASPDSPAAQPRPGTEDEQVRQRRTISKPWNILGISKTSWTRTRTPWGKDGMSKKKWLRKQGVSAYHYEKLARAGVMRLQTVQEAADEAAFADTGAPASKDQELGGRRTRSEARMVEEDEEEDEDEDDGNSARSSSDGTGAPCPDSDSDSDFVP